MNSKRVAFLLLAVIVAGATAFLARAWLQAERAAIIAQAGGQRPVAQAKPAVQVLVARTAIRVGQLIKPDDLRWQPWPQGALPTTYIIEGRRPISDFVGAVARSSFHVGEPIVEVGIVMPGSRGFLAAVLRSGMRAVSVPATATSTVSGLIYAGDRVDVLLTHVLNGPGGQHSATETILRNARVIAMDQKLDFTPGDKPDVAKTATLELTPKQTEIVTLAVKMGDLSLVLRSLQDPEEGDRDPAVADEVSAELGYSYTHDSQVSRLIKSPTEAPPPEATRSNAVFLLRGASRTKQELDGSTSADPPAPPTPDAAKDSAKPGPRTTTFTRTIPSVPQ
ncbi:MAG: Flp pilus assembly protein CpaB [Reyranella sp.]|uniref:Flp pilus assembly protein CpaB n=1 Tax=Reyranella sp. TaxID=1929291 RepID=UPI00272FB09B|nr:Flp pilus assembly protein CpaB [Reyranella sp.]MDP1964195.1 Flp pilus assembly protein CpaB [Reyranella sp.]MDP2373710.1 Flp pilus assembly protein CpaB [Reyranella sp.]